MAGVLAVLFGQRRRAVNFSNPFSARQWLMLLRAEPDIGLGFKPDFEAGPAQLGFTFKANRLGLHGPCAEDAPGVILGTSFAMGLSVDEGRNWYDLLLDPERWFNGAMPVGPANHAAVLDRHYRGSGKVLIYLYHPNIWRTAQGFDQAAAEDKSIFEQMGWSTSWAKAAGRYPRWVVREIVKWLGGFTHYPRWDGQRFYLNATYFKLDPDRNTALIAIQLERLRGLFARFDRVIVVRTPIKEDCLPESLATPRLMALQAQYEQLWHMFCNGVAKTDGKVSCHRLDHGAFAGQHFHPFDTHWSATGNMHFASALRPILETAGVGGLRPRSDIA